MDLRQLQYFVALYEENSITKAARRLHVVQPAVSMQIRRLEADYDLTLFDRTPQGVYPNDTARRLYPMCIDILDRVEQARQVLRDTSGQLSGALSVGIPPSMAHGVLASVLFEFREHHPQVQLTIAEGYSAHLVEWLLQGEIEFAVLSDFGEQKRLRYEPLATEELMIITNSQTQTTDEAITGDQLGDLELIVPSAPNQIRILLDTELDRRGLRLRPSMEVDSLTTVLAMVRKPGWASILPASAIRNLAAENDMRCLRLVDPVVERKLVAAFPVQKATSIAATYFIDALRSALTAPVMLGAHHNPV